MNLNKTLSTHREICNFTEGAGVGKNEIIQLFSSKNIKSFIAQNQHIFALWDAEDSYYS